MNDQTAVQSSVDLKTGDLKSGFETSPSTANIVPAFVKAQAKFMAVAKSSKNSEFKFNYATLDDYFEVIRQPLADNELMIVCNIEERWDVEGRTTKNGTPWNTTIVRIRQRLWHSSGEWIDFICYGEGMAMDDKSFYKAVTGARKYALTLLGLATADDPDHESPGRERSDKDRNHGDQRKQGSQPVTKRDREQQSANQNASARNPAVRTPPSRDQLLKAIQTLEAKMLGDGYMSGVPQLHQARLSCRLDSLDAATVDDLSFYYYSFKKQYQEWKSAQPAAADSSLTNGAASQEKEAHR